ncbi:hypothetical protein QQO24_13900 [Ralstonia pseudosolanacearum]|nr:hypothetical protein [Ralstonia pseudosolanacearum]MDN3368259.1 hypothetical protein [Ralstonia pseudosolanacearum]
MAAQPNTIAHQYRLGTVEQCAAAAALVSPQLLAQAEEVRMNQWDWHPEASLPDGYMLGAFYDGVWIIDAEADLHRALRFVRVGDSWG